MKIFISYNLKYLLIYITHLTNTLPIELEQLSSLQYFIFPQTIDFNDLELILNQEKSHEFLVLSQLFYLNY